MNAKVLLRVILRLVLVALLLGGVATVAGNAVQAQRRSPQRVIIVRPIRPYRAFDPFGRRFDRFNRFDYYGQYVFSNGESAYSQGYKDGLKTGNSDGGKEKSYDPERSHYFHDAGFGNFAEAYRSGFSRGYADGFGSCAIG